MPEEHGGSGGGGEAGGASDAGACFIRFLGGEAVKVSDRGHYVAHGTCHALASRHRTSRKLR